MALLSCAPNRTSDPAYLSAYAQTPRLNVACVGESNRPGPVLEFGPNACTLVLYPTDARDVNRAEYTVTIFYRAPAGNLFSSRFENRTREIKGDTPMSYTQAATASFPVYIPDTNFFRITGRLLESTFKVVLSLAPAALGNYLGIPIPAIGLDKTTEGLYKQMSTAINDLINNKEQPYAVQVTARLCGPQLCSPAQSQLIKLPQ
ncbi:MAG: hypothetical protein K6T57_09595 [Thermaceae bacterium]|uniref:Uncharacterized protein n=2 Tax=Meiothermus TaxID=65551 RepID=A0A399F5R6_9DEIN|nr:hypothetical protein [Thermaceae bacterium]RIH92107.1 hypothetical protein Mgrana_01984 [Meiothermus granaticius NBRC 107808]GEM86278.1 hypothetical protein MGR01S_09030 [Meiothermus granaticius NBRC 107808]